MLLTFLESVCQKALAEFRVRQDTRTLVNVIEQLQQRRIPMVALLTPLEEAGPLLSGRRLPMRRDDLASLGMGATRLAKQRCCAPMPSPGVRISWSRSARNSRTTPVSLLPLGLGLVWRPISWLPLGLEVPAATNSSHHSSVPTSIRLGWTPGLTSKFRCEISSICGRRRFSPRMAHPLGGQSPH